MPENTVDMVTLKDACASLDLSHHSVEQWISRGHFRPRHEISRGQARLFDLTEFIRLLAVSELVEMGLSPTIAGKNVPPTIHGHKSIPIFLIIWTGCSPASVMGGGAPQMIFDVEGAIYNQLIIETKLVDFINNPRVRVTIVVSLNKLEKRALEAMHGLRGEGKTQTVERPKYSKLSDRMASYFGT